VYHDDLWLKYSVASIYDAVGAIFFFVGAQPWFGDNEDNSSTLEAIAGLPDPQRKISLIRDNWPDEASQRNFSAAYAQVAGFDYGFIVDADEIYDTRCLQEMMRYAESRPDVECWHMKWLTYWKSLRYIIDPPESYLPPVFIKLGTCGFVEARNPAAASHEIIPPEIGICHHMSYARSDELIRRKISSFSHARQILPTWYETVWKAWDANTALTNLHPVHPEQYRRAEEQPRGALPPVLQELAARCPNFPLPEKG
jgi:hypothetical protein